MADPAVARTESGTEPQLTIRGLNVRPVDVPLEDPVITASGTVASAPLVLVDLLTEEGITGCTYIFTYTPAALLPTAQLVQNLAAMIVGDPVAPSDLDRKLQQRFRLLGAEGLTGMALAAIDMAAWDALARSRTMPLAELLGGTRARYRSGASGASPVPVDESLGLVDDYLTRPAASSVC